MSSQAPNGAIGIKTQEEVERDLVKFFPKTVTKDSARPPGGHVEALYNAVMFLLKSEDDEDTSWGIALADKLQAVEANMSAVHVMAEKIEKAERQVAELTLALTLLQDQKVGTSDLAQAADLLATKVDALKASLLAVTAKLDAENVTGLDTDYTATVTPTLV